MTDHNRNPEGHGGFQQHPENINKKGRPKIDGTEMLKAALEKFKNDPLYKDNPAYGDLMENIVKRAFTSDTLATAILKKILPSMSEIKTDGTLTISDLMKIVQGAKPNEEKKEEKE